MSGFEQFWAKYPRHIGKMAARKRWERLNPSPETVERILAALEWQIQDPNWCEERYIPHASTYLNQARWEDEAPRPRPDSRGHYPPCRTMTECNRKLEAEIDARKASVS